ncbi:uncharacterized protein LOC124247232 [Equus quagga]|uniref:uncharacterized protein LOC124247232 n=1 Tax=Equus quagga TaxID=89248 RepID=UPI001EE2DA6D|nr:uncharacterized protein LOC124247232 [Equus quagga]
MVFGFPPFGEVFVWIESGERELQADAARCARSLPTALAPSPRPVACLAASVFSGRPSLRLDSFGEPLPFFPFFFFFCSGRSRGAGRVDWRALKKKNVLVQQLQFCATGTAPHRQPLSPPGPRFVAGCPRTSVPLSLVSWPRPPPRRVSPQLRRLGHCSWLLAELWKPPRLNAAPADVTAASDQSAARGPSVNHSASPGPGECRETAFRGSVAAASAARRGAGGGQRGARAPSCSGPPEKRGEAVKGGAWAPGCRNASGSLKEEQGASRCVLDPAGPGDHANSAETRKKGKSKV